MLTPSPGVCDPTESGVRPLDLLSLGFDLVRIQFVDSYTIWAGQG